VLRNSQLPDFDLDVWLLTTIGGLRQAVVVTGLGVGLFFVKVRKER
jgi:hypothetical protein